MRRYLKEKSGVWGVETVAEGVEILDDRITEGIVMIRIRDEYRWEVGSEAMGSSFLCLRPGVICLKEGGRDGFMGKLYVC